MTTIISVDGGIGRVITSIPALLKYHKNHPDEEWYIMIPGWDFVTWGFPELQERTFSPDTKGSFNLYWKADKVITAEPYRVPAYYRNEISLREAFDVAINESTDHDDLPDMQLRLSSPEKRKAFEILERAKKQHQKEKTIVFQPFGSSATPHESGIYDDSNRSMPKDMISYFIKNLSEKYNLIFMGAKEFHNVKTYKPDPDPQMREWMAIIEAADYFIGCDSCGQHMRRAFNKPASVMVAGTHKVNTSYDNFHIIERNVAFQPDSMRISGFHSHMCARLNEERVNFTEKEIKSAYQEVISRIESNSSKPKVLETKLKNNIGVTYS
jgi:ADP-heptose:LPS heptosyltransferase|tara:strand:- start:2013 stop:2987 length:975 start_codon:yes stop_codon:yes gene_type:complete